MGNERSGILIQARSGSTRLPGKIFSRLILSQPLTMLDFIYARMQRVLAADMVAFIVPENDSLLIDFLKRRNYNFFKGSEQDVRERYRQAALHYDLDTIVRATGDNPCVDPGVAMDTLLHFQTLDCDLFSYNNLPLGVAVEVFRREALLDNRIAEDPQHREHVSLHIKHNPQIYCVQHASHPLMKHYGDLKPPRLTVDTAEDLAVVRGVFEVLGAEFTLRDVLDLFGEGHDFFLLNQHVEQLVFPA
ncbi:MAG: hypothetical protein HS115_04335 [Spirochaetales bacterium]|nr:hypothetical protein [Spirochaetales bacterium]